MTQQEFNTRLQTHATPPRGVKKWLYNNRETILLLLLTLILGEEKAKQAMKVIEYLKE